MEFKRAMAHGVSGGTIAEVRGDGFASGFFAGTASSFVSHAEFSSNWGSTQHAIAAAVVGGTAARLGGGKFENGAVTGAFQFLFNSKLSGMAKSRQLDDIDRANIKANDEALEMDFPGREKFWVLAERVDPRTGETSIVRSDIVIGSSDDGNITPADMRKAYDSLGSLKYGRILAEGHTHPINVGVSLADVRHASNLSLGNTRFYMGKPNRNVYIVQTTRPSGIELWLATPKWFAPNGIYFNSDKYQERIR